VFCGEKISLHIVCLLFIFAPWLKSCARGDSSKYKRRGNALMPRCCSALFATAKKSNNNLSGESIAGERERVLFLQTGGNHPSFTKTIQEIEMRKEKHNTQNIILNLGKSKI